METALFVLTFLDGVVRIAGYEPAELCGPRLPDGAWQDRRVILATLKALGFKPRELAGYFGLTPRSAEELARRARPDARLKVRAEALLKEVGWAYLKRSDPDPAPAGPEPCPRCLKGTVLGPPGERACLNCGYEA